MIPGRRLVLGSKICILVGIYVCTYVWMDDVGVLVV